MTTTPVGSMSGNPFQDVEEAWFWAVRGHDAFMDGARPVAGRAENPKPCEARDIMVVLSRIIRRGGLSRRHVEVLFRYARRDFPPDDRLPKEAADALLWREALAELAPVLWQKGLVVDPNDTSAGGCHDRAG